MRGVHAPEIHLPPSELLDYDLDSVTSEVSTAAASAGVDAEAVWANFESSLLRELASTRAPRLFRFLAVCSFGLVVVFNFSWTLISIVDGRFGLAEIIATKLMVLSGVLLWLEVRSSHLVAYLLPLCVLSFSVIFGLLILAEPKRFVQEFLWPGTLGFLGLLMMILGLLWNDVGQREHEKKNEQLWRRISTLRQARILSAKSAVATTAEDRGNQRLSRGSKMLHRIREAFVSDRRRQ